MRQRRFFTARLDAGGEIIPLKKQEEIDIVALDGKNILLCECKWQNASIGAEVLEDLMKQGNLFYAEQKYFYVFAKEAFSEECKKKAAEVPNLGLVTFSEMLNYS